MTRWGDDERMRRMAGVRLPLRRSCSIVLLVAPRGDFLCEQKVTKESHRERVFRLPLSL